MGSLPVIEHLDVIEDARSGFFPGGEPVMVNQLVLEIAEEAFDHGVVVAVAFATHANFGADLMQLGLIIGPGISVRYSRANSTRPPCLDFDEARQLPNSHHTMALRCTR